MEYLERYVFIFTIVFRIFYAGTYVILKLLKDLHHLLKMLNFGIFMEFPRILCYKSNAFLTSLTIHYDQRWFIGQSKCIYDDISKYIYKHFAIAHIVINNPTTDGNIYQHLWWKNVVSNVKRKYWIKIWFNRNIHKTFKYFMFLPCEILTAGILIRMLFFQQKMYIDMDAGRNVTKYGLDLSRDDK